MPRGDGNVYRRGGSRFWWVRYSVDGKPQYESSKSERREDAEELLACRLQERGARRRVLDGTLEAAVGDYLQNAKLRGLRAVPVLERRARNALDYFGRYARVSEIRPLRLSDYQHHLVDVVRLAPSTVNASLSVLQSILKLAATHEYIAHVPTFPRSLRKPEPRRGFLERDDFDAVAAELPTWAADVFTFAYVTGWRRTEILWLTWDEVNWDEREIVLSSARSKNRDSRTRPICAALEVLLARRRAARVVGLPFVFHRAGRKIGLTGLRNAFQRAKVRAGRPSVLLHDCRRTAARDLVRRGVHPQVAAALVGWRSQQMLERYNITSRADLREAVGLSPRPSKVIVRGSHEPQEP